MGPFLPCVKHVRVRLHDLKSFPYRLVCLLLGWVLLIGEDFEQARVLIALLISIVFLAMQLIIQPFKR
jgi:hypothetical protein